ncbi:glutaredoxin family protein [Deinococcus hopiensis]|uniref:Glutaredoxin and related proteins n=1 Tax=Deinococcus hopiensis KR-140 TaxID=695939 RepID=A0A1W1VKH1_9DEIO|nr:glutaredoxin family protein [Deinococcus hopiensis]SMB93869.1 Glutaredoxin and related proteins [Deinococcus hopiensis KR-140]
MPRLPELTLYTRAGCHLCEQAQAALNALAYRYVPVDVDSDPLLRSRYGNDVPVLALEDRALLKGVLNRGRLSVLKLQLLRETAPG